MFWSTKRVASCFSNFHLPIYSKKAYYEGKHVFASIFKILLKIYAYHHCGVCSRCLNKDVEPCLTKKWFINIVCYGIAVKIVIKF